MDPDELRDSITSTLMQQGYEAPPNMPDSTPPSGIEGMPPTPDGPSNPLSFLGVPTTSDADRQKFRGIEKAIPDMPMPKTPSGDAYSGRNASSPPLPSWVGGFGPPNYSVMTTKGRRR